METTRGYWRIGHALPLNQCRNDVEEDGPEDGEVAGGGPVDGETVADTGSTIVADENYRGWIALGEE